MQFDRDGKLNLDYLKRRIDTPSARLEFAKEMALNEFHGADKEARELLERYSKLVLETNLSPNDFFEHYIEERAIEKSRQLEKLSRENLDEILMKAKAETAQSKNESNNSIPDYIQKLADAAVHPIARNTHNGGNQLVPPMQTAGKIVVENSGPRLS